MVLLGVSMVFADCSLKRVSLCFLFPSVPDLPTLMVLSPSIVWVFLKLLTVGGESPSTVWEDAVGRCLFPKPLTLAALSPSVVWAFLGLPTIGGGEGEITRRVERGRRIA